MLTAIAILPNLQDKPSFEELCNALESLAIQPTTWSADAIQESEAEDAKAVNDYLFSIISSDMHARIFWPAFRQSNQLNSRCLNPRLLQATFTGWTIARSKSNSRNFAGRTGSTVGSRSTRASAPMIYCSRGRIAGRVGGKMKWCSRPVCGAISSVATPRKRDG